MTLTMQSDQAEEPRTWTPPTPIVALDVPGIEAAERLIAALPSANFFKVGLQLYTAAGPEIVRRLKGAGHRVFLDLKFHDIPNTVAGAVRSAAELGVDLLTIHASGGSPMMSAATEAALASSPRPLIFAVSVLTSLSPRHLAEAWGREEATPDEEVARLSGLAAAAGVDGLVASVRDIPAAKRGRQRLRFLTPGIRLAGDSAGDQSRIATPAEAASAGADYVVIGRTVSASPDPSTAYARVLAELSSGQPSPPTG